MRLILKLIAAPFIVLLTVLVAVLLFLFSVSSFLLTATSIIMALLGVGLSDQIKSTEAALHTNMELKAATVQYAKTRPVFEKYKASKYSKKFLAEHEADIELYRAACADFKAILGGAKLPKMDTLKEEGRKLSEQKKKLYAEYRKTKADMQEVTTIKANIDYLLGYSEPGRKKEQER